MTHPYVVLKDSFHQEAFFNNIMDAWNGIYTLSRSLWWRRAWVYQEFVLGTRVTFLINGVSVSSRELYELLTTLVTQYDAHKAFWDEVSSKIANEIAEIGRQVAAYRIRNHASTRLVSRVAGVVHVLDSPQDSGIYTRDYQSALAKERANCENRKRKVDTHRSDLARAYQTLERTNFIFKSKIDTTPTNAFLPLFELLVFSRNDEMSAIMQGSLIDRLEAGEVSAEDVCII